MIYNRDITGLWNKNCPQRWALHWTQDHLSVTMVIKFLPPFITCNECDWSKFVGYNIETKPMRCRLRQNDTNTKSISEVQYYVYISDVR